MSEASGGTNTRINLLDELKGNFSTAIIGTFGADLSFFETIFLRQLSTSTRTRIVLVDSKQFAKSSQQDSRLKKLNKTYIASPVKSNLIHHPKFIMLLGKNEGLLHVGSGNLSMSGYAGAGECFTTYRYDREVLESATPFAAVRNMVDLEIALKWIDKPTSARLQRIWDAISWIPSINPEVNPVIHNLVTPILDQFSLMVPSGGVEEIVMAAPFHDRNAQALKEIVTRFKPEKISLLVQKENTKLNIQAVEKELAASGAQVKIFDAKAPEMYGNPFLHAKFILIRTQGADLLLQGSPNLSSVALCNSGRQANVEMANVLVGEKGSHDHILAALDLQERREGLTGFLGAKESEDDDDFHVPPTLLHSVTWQSPMLSGLINDENVSAIQIWLAGYALSPIEIRLTPDLEQTAFRLEFDLHNALLIDGASYLEIAVNGGDAIRVFPYHNQLLDRLASANKNSYLLDEVGDLDVRDKELEDLVAELSNILILDRDSLTSISSRRATKESEETVQEGHMSYDEIDWERLDSIPLKKAFNSLYRQDFSMSSDIYIVLQSLSSRFKRDAGIGLVVDSAGDFTESVDELDIENDFLDDEEFDEMEEIEDEERVIRRQSEGEREKRIWRNFLGRFINGGLENEKFVRLVGQDVLISQYVIFNGICRRLRITKKIDEEVLLNYQIQLWNFMWGKPDTPGYLESLNSSDMKIALDFLAKNDDISLTLSAISDACGKIEKKAGVPVELRNIWRVILGNPLWNVTKSSVKMAASAALLMEGDANLLVAKLTTLAQIKRDDDLQFEFAKQVGVKVSEIRMAEARVRRDGKNFECKYLQLESQQVSKDLAEVLLATWHKLLPQIDYLRIHAASARIVADFSSKEFSYHDLGTGDTSPIEIKSPPINNWEKGLSELARTA